MKKYNFPGDKRFDGHNMESVKAFADGLPHVVINSSNGYLVSRHKTKEAAIKRAGSYTGLIVITL